jgi:hypothetical protein
MMHVYPYISVDIIFKYKTDMCFPLFTSLSVFSEYERLGPLSTTPYVCFGGTAKGQPHPSLFSYSAELMSYSASGRRDESLAIDRASLADPAAAMRTLSP